MYRPIEIILADDHEIFRDGFHLMIRKSKEIQMMAEASNGAELIRLAHLHQPDVIITDIQMPEMDGITATRILKRDMPHVGIIALTMFKEDYQLHEMLEAGARGYLVKNAPKNEVIEAIKSVYNQMSYVDRETSRKLSADGDVPANLSKITSAPEFSEREKDVMRLICEQLSSKEIADRIGMSKRTVEWYRETIFEKTKARNVAGIVIYAMQHKIYTPGGQYNGDG